MNRPIAALIALGAFTAWTAPARAQTWAANRTTPTLNEVVAVDATGEANWPYGQEDVAGDGLNNFQPTEQQLDLRTAYAVADAQRFWCRVYVSNPNAVGGAVTVYIFVDTDQNPATGGDAAAQEIDSRFTSDPSNGGYEVVIGIGGNGMIAGVWQWDGMQFASVNYTPADYVPESGSDVDPIQINDAGHGYVQVSAALSVVGLTSQCDANIFIRSVNGSASMTAQASDLNAGEATATCVPVDANNNGVPDVVETTGCQSSAECPSNGVCINRQCVLSTVCTVDADCAADEQCLNGVCVARPMGNCTTTADCGDLVCDGNMCVPCTQASMCGTGRTCGPDGRCVQGTAMNGTGGTSGTGGAGPGAGNAGFGGLVDEPGEEVQGGACTCVVAKQHRRETGAIAALAAALAFVARRRRK